MEIIRATITQAIKLAIHVDHSVCTLHKVISRESKNRTTLPNPPPINTRK